MKILIFFCKSPYLNINININIAPASGRMLVSPFFKFSMIFLLLEQVTERISVTPFIYFSNSLIAISFIFSKMFPTKSLRVTTKLFGIHGTGNTSAIRLALIRGGVRRRSSASFQVRQRFPVIVIPKILTTHGSSRSLAGRTGNRDG